MQVLIKLPAGNFIIIKSCFRGTIHQPWKQYVCCICGQKEKTMHMCHHMLHLWTERKSTAYVSSYQLLWLISIYGSKVKMNFFTSFFYI